MIFIQNNPRYYKFLGNRNNVYQKVDVLERYRADLV